MKIISTFALFLCLSVAVNAQLFVDTLQHNKNVLIEEFTGVQCNSCPQGHIEINNLLAAYPNRVFAAGMHSGSVGHSEPYPGDEDLRRTFPDLLSAQVYNLVGIPSGMISRRKSNTNQEDFIFWPFPSYHAPIDSAVNAVMAEVSPFNIGVHADYDTVNKVLHVTSQVFTKLASSGNFRVNVYFTQSNIFVSQLNGSTVIPNYNEKHVFREIMTPTWGSSMAPAGAAQGSVYNYAHTFSNSIRNYKMQDVEVIVFITNHAGVTSLKGNVITAIGVPVTLTGVITTAVNEQPDVNELNVYPNPSGGIFMMQHTGVGASIEVFNSTGVKVYAVDQANGQSSIDLRSFPAGLYFLNLKTEKGTTVRKLMKE